MEEQNREEEIIDAADVDAMKCIGEMCEQLRNGKPDLRTFARDYMGACSTKRNFSLPDRYLYAMEFYKAINRHIAC